MAILQLEKFVPYIYPNESRDFQVLLKYYNYLINGIKHDIDQIADVIDTEKCNSKILYLLQSKLGFFSTAKITDEELRYVLSAFPYIIRNKGSFKAIRQAVNVFCKLNKITSGYRILYKNKVLHAQPTEEEEEQFGDETYIILIEIMSSFKDTTILDEIFKYILPPTYEIKYMFMSTIHADDTVMTFDSNISYEVLPDEYLNMEIYNSDEYFGQKYTQETQDKILIKVGTEPIRNRVGTAVTSNYSGEKTYISADEEEYVVDVQNAERYVFNENENTRINNYDNLENILSGNTDTTVIDK